MARIHKGFLFLVKRSSDGGSVLGDMGAEVAVMALISPSWSLRSCWGKGLQPSRPNTGEVECYAGFSLKALQNKG